MNEINKLQSNLSNQNFDYYLPKITIKKMNVDSREEMLFPGYIFINTNLHEYSRLKYTRGIKSIIKFGKNISYITNDEMEKIKTIERSSKIQPIASKLRIGQEARIASGSFKGILVKICSLPAKKRVDVFLSLLGSVRKVNVPEKDLII